ncbi:hypothetical protein JCM8547_002390 [Rhodosporidiobolus lusitaniae]
MPKPEVTRFFADNRYRFTLTWDITIDLGAQHVMFKQPVRKNSVFLPGSWAVRVKTMNDGVDVLLAQQGRNAARRLRSGHSTDAEPSLNTETNKVYPRYGVRIEKESFEKAELRSKGEFQLKTHRAYRLVFIVEHKLDELIAEARQKSASDLAERSGNINLQQVPHDVRIFFPHAHENGAELWSKSGFLSASSRSFKTLLASTFAESSPRRSKRKGTGTRSSTSADQIEAYTKNFEDSDDETDRFLFAKSPPSLQQPSETDELVFKEITVTEAAFSTYHTVLVFLQTSHVCFAPLSSSFPSSRHASRIAFLENECVSAHSLPPHVSPKSAYRLTHLLELDDLKKRCLQEYPPSLTIQGAAHKPFDDASLCYEEIRDVVLDFVEKNWEAMKNSEGWKEKSAEIEAGQATGEEAAVLLSLWKRGVKV